MPGLWPTSKTCLLRTGALRSRAGEFHLTQEGQRFLRGLDIDADALRGLRRSFVGSCLDWTERKPHLAGALPAALLGRFLELGWLDRRRSDRGLTITDLGHANLPALGQLAAPGSLTASAR